MRIANPTPTYCSACFNQDVETRHVDFEAYYDGPVIDAHSGVKQVIDDLFLCESCVRSAGELIGMVQDEKAAEDLKKLRSERIELKRELTDVKGRLNTITQAVTPVAA